MPSARPRALVGFPFSSNTCQASAPPFCQPVPSSQTRIVSPSPLAASAGCLRPPGALGGASGFDRRCCFLSTREKNTWPSVSHAADTALGPSRNDSLLMGQLATIHLPASSDRNVFPPSVEVSS